jgi:hypothetical protein
MYKDKKELLWISEHSKEIEKYAGKWIAVLSNKVIAVGDSAKRVMEEVKKKRIKKLPLVTKVPRKDEEMYIL